MRIKLDENLPAEMEALLSARGHDIETWARCFVVIGNKKLRIIRP